MNILSAVLTADKITLMILGVCVLLSFFRFFYIAAAFRPPVSDLRTKKRARFAVLIPARNESRVIRGILESVRAQDYDPALVRVTVIVESETDPTVEIVRSFGYDVFVRTRLEGRRTKGYALEEAVTAIREEGQEPDAYLVFDADNRFESDYFLKMNTAYQDGIDLAMGYHNSRNYRQNRHTLCSEMSFLLVNTLSNIGKSKYLEKLILTGTGFYLSAAAINKAGGFAWHGLTEDYDISYWVYLHNIRCRYVPDAVFYDEQSSTAAEIRKQHNRWIRGLSDVGRRYQTPLLRALFSKSQPNKVAIAERAFGLIPLILAIAAWLCNIAVSIGFGIFGWITGVDRFWLAFVNAGAALLLIYLFAMLLTALTFALNRRSLPCTAWEKIKTCFCFPLFLLDMVRAFFYGLFHKKIAWDPVKHTGAEDNSTASDKKSR